MSARSHEGLGGCSHPRGSRCSKGPSWGQEVALGPPAPPAGPVPYPWTHLEGLGGVGLPRGE